MTMTVGEAKDLLIKWFQPTTEPEERDRAIVALGMAINALDELEKIWEVANIKRAVMGGVGDLREIQIIKYADNLIDELSVLKSAINTKYVVNNLAAYVGGEVEILLT